MKNATVEISLKTQSKYIQCVSWHWALQLSFVTGHCNCLLSNVGTATVFCQLSFVNTWALQLSFVTFYLLCHLFKPAEYYMITGCWRISDIGYKIHYWNIILIGIVTLSNFTIVYSHRN
jgi:hypothetical protein